MKTHPLAILCYNRPQHLHRVLERLRLPAPPLLHVFQDGPRSEEDRKRTTAVAEAIRDDIDWTWPCINTSVRNLGMRRSVVRAADAMMLRYDAAMFLEDDCLPGPYCLDYMAEALERYRGSPQVMSVGAYTPPLPADLLQDYPYDVYFIPRIETWGWATWRRAWVNYERDYRVAFDACAAEGVDLACCGSDTRQNIKAHLEGRLNGWSPGWLMGVMRRKGLCVYPIRSLVQNIGMDGSGDCPASSHRDVSLWLEKPLRWPAEPFVSERIQEVIKRFYGG